MNLIVFVKMLSLPDAFVLVLTCQGLWRIQLEKSLKLEVNVGVVVDVLSLPSGDTQSRRQGQKIQSIIWRMMMMMMTMVTSRREPLSEGEGGES